MLARRKNSAISSQEISEFRDNGFVKLNGLLNARELTVLRSAMRKALESLSLSPNSYDVTAAADAFWHGDVANDNQGSQQHDLDALARAIRQSSLPRLVDPAGDGPRGRFLLDTGVWRRVQALAEFAQNSVLPEIAAALLDANAIRFYDDQMFVKEPRAVDRAAFHQDISYFHLDGAAGCVFWIPLDRVRAGGGRMGYIPGSHHWGQTFKPNVFVSALPFPGSQGADMPAINEDPLGFGARFVDVEAGDVIVHHFLTVHGSEGNRKGSPRQAFSLRYCDAALRFQFRPGAPAQPLHRVDVHDGDELDRTIHPVVWKDSASTGGPPCEVH